MCADTNGETPLSIALKFGQFGVVHRLLGKKGVDVNTQEQFYGETPLSRAEKMYERAVGVGTDPDLRQYLGDVIGLLRQLKAKDDM
jgi:hypothetical protein